MFQAASGPQVQVISNDILAACEGDCSYTFITNTPEVTAQSLSGSIVTIQMSDPQNWAYDTSVLSIKLDGQTCTVASGTFTSFTCQMPTNTDSSPVLTAGDWDV